MLFLRRFFMLFAVVLQAVGKDVIALAEVVQQRIENRTGGHFTVALNVVRTAEGEKRPDARGL